MHHTANKRYAAQKPFPQGSRNHLRVFMKHLIQIGGTYAPTYLTQDQIDEILNSPMERGHLDAQGKLIFGSIGW
ncbi:MAG: DUF2202 domain-containing protein [Candidatus Aminicenantaceae bacterium]